MPAVPIWQTLQLLPARIRLIWPHEVPMLELPAILERKPRLLQPAKPKRRMGSSHHHDVPSVIPGLHAEIQAG